MSRAYKTEGIIIKRINFGEADRIITIFTKHHGKIKAIAKGIRKIKSRRAPHLELFNQAILFLNQGKNFDLISQAQIINSFSNLRKDLKRVGLAFEVCELVDQLTREGQSQRQVFDFLVVCLNDLSHFNKERAEEVVRTFELRLLESLGFLAKDRVLKNLNIERFVEEISERELKTKKFLSKI